MIMDDNGSEHPEFLGRCSYNISQHQNHRLSKIDTGSKTFSVEEYLDSTFSATDDLSETSRLLVLSHLRKSSTLLAHAKKDRLSMQAKLIQLADNPLG